MTKLLKSKLRTEDQGTQKLENLIYLIKKLELDKKNDQILISLIDFCFYILFTYFSHIAYTYNLPTCVFFSEIIQLHIFLEYLSFICVRSKLSILPNHVKHLKRLIP